MRNFSLSLLAIFVICFAYSGCHGPEAGALGIMTAVGRKDTDRKHKSKIIGSEESKWNVEYLEVGRNELLQSINVFDNRSMNIVGDRDDIKTLHKTVDGGKTWEALKIEVPAGKRMSGMAFLNPKRGLISLISQEGDYFNVSYKSTIMVTTDGGNSWANAIEMDSALLNDIAFDSKGTAWVAGGTYSIGKPYTAVGPLLLKSADLRYWEEEPVEPKFTGSVEYIKIPDDNSVILAGTKGQIIELESTMAVRAYYDLNSLMPASMGVRNLDKAGDILFLIGANPRQHGTFTSIFSKASMEDDWKHYELNDVSFTDLIVLSSTELLACGSIDNRENRELSKGEGVILHSIDGGKTWLIAHRSVRAWAFDDIAKVSDGSFWITGRDSLLLHLIKADTN